MYKLDEIIGEIEVHSVEGIRRCFSEGLDPNITFNGEPLIYELTSEYARTPAFKDCIKAFVEYGLKLEDNILLSVLLNDSINLERLIHANPQSILKKYNLRCSYTPLYGASLLHICAEFNHVNCARVLIENGLNVNVKAGIDENGFGGQTAIFHTVNQNSDNSRDMMNYLISKSADLKTEVTGLIWGKGYEWETFIPCVNPISYAMMGLLPQMHRDEIIVSEIISILLENAYGIVYKPVNVPCRYLKDS